MNYSEFVGVFDGKGFTISNMQFTCVQNGYNKHPTYDYQGLFGVISGGATVKDFTIKGKIILAADGQKYIGGAVGLAYDGAKIENVTSYVDITDDKGVGTQGFTGISQIGGVVGQLGRTGENNTSATAENCRYHGTISVNTASSVGGIAGQSMVDNSLVQNCVNYGTVGWNYIAHAGGVVGSAQLGTQVKNCANFGEVSIIRNDCVGGVVGYANERVRIENCANYANIEAKKSDVKNEPNVYLGGILGYVNNRAFSALTGCFNYGNVTDLDNSYTYTGAIVGYINKDTTASVIQNNAYLDTSCKKAYGTNSSSTKPGTTTSATAAQFASGEIAYLLNGGKTDGTQAWYQELTDASKLDKYPVLSGKTVYYTGGDNGSYANTVDASHSFDTNGICTDCGKIRYLVYDEDDGIFKTAIAVASPLPSSSTHWESGRYYVTGSRTIEGTVYIGSDVELILCDGATLTVNGSITSSEGGSSFTVYAQSDEASANLGKLIVTTSGTHSGFFATWVGSQCLSVFTIHGGIVAVGSDDAQACNLLPTFKGNYRLYAGFSLSELTPITYYSARNEICMYQSAFRFEPCTDHEYAPICADTGKHIVQCKWCGYDPHEQAHDFGESNRCVCGYGQISYREYNPETKQYENKTVLALPITNGSSPWESGWYYVPDDVTIEKRVTVSGDVKLILPDDVTLTITGGISVNEGNTFTVYAQSDEASASLGKLIARWLKFGYTGYDAVIGADALRSAGTIIFHGGNITANAAPGFGAGIGGSSTGTENGIYTNYGTIIIHGGIVNAYGGNRAAGIGGGDGTILGGVITINGGIVNATGSNGAGIGGGTLGYGGTITINGGTVNATGSNGPGIGSGPDSGKTDLGETGFTAIVINGGTVNATGSELGNGIGKSGSEGNFSNLSVIIKGGTVTSVGGSESRAFDSPTISGYFHAFVGSAADNLYDVLYADRGNLLTTSRIVKLVPCSEQAHDGLHYSPSGDEHMATCPWSNAAITGAHKSDENGRCICGATAHIYLSYNAETAHYDTKIAYALPLTSSQMQAGSWYYVEGNVTFDTGMRIPAGAKLILCNGATLTVNGGIFGSVTSGGSSLTVYAQSMDASAGKLIVQNVPSGRAGIECDLIVCGGNITVFGNGSANALSGTVTFVGENIAVYGGTSRGTLAPIEASSDACKQHMAILIVCGAVSGNISVDITWTSMSFTYTDVAWNPGTHGYTGGWMTTGGTVTVTNRGTSDLTAQLRFSGAIDGISGTLSKADMTVAAGASDTAALSLAGKPGTVLDQASLGSITVTIRTARNGWYYDASGKAYLYRDGTAATGWQTVEEKTYHFDESGVLSDGLCIFNAEAYFFGIDGSMATGFATGANGKKYYAGGNGRLQTGWQTIDGETYYFFPAESDQPYVMATGIVEIEGEEYWFSIDGTLSEGSS